MQAARVQQPVGEDMAAFGIGAKLDLVDRQEVGAITSGIASTVADPVCGAFGHDALLAGDQRHHRRAAQARTMRS